MNKSAKQVIVVDFMAISTLSNDAICSVNVSKLRLNIVATAMSGK